MVERAGLDRAGTSVAGMLASAVAAPGNTETKQMLAGVV
jgi:hypothetical protein